VSAASEGTVSGGHTRRVHEATVRPLPRRELARFIDAAKAYVPDPPDRWPWNMARTLLFLVCSGAHPEVIVHARTRKLRLTGEGEERRIEWIRPKTLASVWVPLDPLIEPFAGEYIESLVALEGPTHVTALQHYTVKEEYFLPDPAHAGAFKKIQKEAIKDRWQDICALPCSRAIAAACRGCGFPGLTARGLRHTYGKRLAVMSGNNTNIVRKFLKTSAQVANMYTDDDEDDVTDLVAAVRSGK
jgi:integrase